MEQLGVQPESTGVPAVVTEADILNMVKRLVNTYDIQQNIIAALNQQVRDLTPDALQVAQLYADHQNLKNIHAKTLQELADRDDTDDALDCSLDASTNCTGCPECRA